MRITKDEARILAFALEHAEFDLCQLISRTREESELVLEALETLQEKLEVIGQDNRRKGRGSQDPLSSVLKRFIKGRK